MCTDMDNQIDNLINTSFSEFFNEERHIIDIDANERCLCHRLAVIIERHLLENNIINYYVDTEYNRNIGRERRIKAILDNRGHPINITCDIIVHSRGENIQRDNILAIEMKKGDPSDPRMNSDRQRLRALTSDNYPGWSHDGTSLPEYVCRYYTGIFIVIDTSESRYLFEKYQHGEMINESGWINIGQ